MTKTFTNTIGHDKQKKLFLKAFEKGKLGHSYALVGPRGVGKATFARDFAEILGARPILDIFDYDSEKFTIEQARELRGNLRLKSSSGGYRVGIVNQAHAMTRSAANSLLKILEEPPARSIVFLVTENKYALLPTIASRVQSVRFAGMREQEMREIVGGWPGRDLELILEISNGRLGVAISIARDPALRDFYANAKRYWEAMEKGSLAERLLSSQSVSRLPGGEISRYLEFAMRKWLREGSSPELGNKIISAFGDQRANVNTKLLLDNLFIAS